MIELFKTNHKKAHNLVKWGQRWDSSVKTARQWAKWKAVFQQKSMQKSTRQTSVHVIK